VVDEEERVEDVEPLHRCLVGDAPRVRAVELRQQVAANRDRLAARLHDDRQRACTSRMF
jgi:hypothetical protein